MVPNTQAPSPPDTNDAPLAVPNYGKTRDEYAAENERLRATISRQAEALAKAREALQCMIELHQHANDGAFENGVTDPTGSIDEGNVLASRIYNDACAAVRAIDEVMK